MPVFSILKCAVCATFFNTAQCYLKLCCIPNRQKVIAEATLSNSRGLVLFSPVLPCSVCYLQHVIRE